MTAFRCAPPPVTALATLLLTAPAPAAACGACADSGIYHAFPWLPAVYLMIFGWYVARTIIRQFWGDVSPLNLADGGIIWMVAFGFVGIVLAGLFGLMTIGGLLSIYILYHHLRDFIVEQGHASLVLLFLAMISVGTILTIAFAGIHERRAMSDLEAFDRYGSTGTALGVNEPKALARDASITNADLRPMLESGEQHRQAKALLILKARQDQNDLLELGDCILPILPTNRPESKPDWGTPVRVLYDWLDDLLLNDIRTRADLNAWLNQMDPGQETGAEVKPE